MSGNKNTTRQAVTGETGTFSHSFPMDDAWEIEDLYAVALVQTYSGNHEILQAGQAQLTGLVAAIGSNVQTGPPSRSAPGWRGTCPPARYQGRGGLAGLRTGSRR